MKKRLWQIFGPVVLAALIVLGLLLAPLPNHKLSVQRLHADAVSLSPTVLGGQRIKHQALAKNYVPFYGSSELARMDPFHPSVLAAKYHRSYQPLLLGDPGTQSLVHFVDEQTMMPQLHGKRAVFIVSMQWFTKQGQIPAAFDQYYSPLQLATWLLKAGRGEADRYAARRLLAMGAPAKSIVMRDALYRVAAGQRLTKSQRVGVQTELQALKNEDNLFSTLSISPRWSEIERGMRQLPTTDDPAALSALATQIGKARTTSNHMGIDNDFFNKRLKGKRLKQLAGSQRGFDYRVSPEYGDFQLLLQQFAKANMNVQFIIPPINQKWARYTGLSMPEYEEAVGKLKYQLAEQGFDKVLDLSQKGSQPYFMQDTIHLGWQGWLAVDHVVKPFLTTPQLAPHYHLNDYFYTKAWAQTKTVG